MNHFIRRLVPLAAIAFVPFAIVSAGETLTMKFQEGETFGYDIQQDMSMEAQGGGNSSQTEIGQILAISTQVKSVAEDGSARAVQTIDRVKMKMVLPAPLSKTIEYDTADEAAPTDPIAQQIAANVSKMVGQGIAMTISPSGEMSDIEIPEAIKQAQQAPGSAMGAADQLEQTFKQSGLRLPTKEISKGHEWDQDMEVTLPFGVMAITTHYTYAGKNEDGLHRIDAKMDVELKQGENSPMKVKATAKEANGSFLFDNEAGRLTSSTVLQVLSIEIGPGAVQNITTKVTMTLRDDESSAR